MIKEKITVEVSRKVVVIMLSARDDELLLLNAYVDSRLQLLKDSGDIKWYSNKVDFFVAMPQTGWEPADLSIEIRKLLRV